MNNLFTLAANDQSIVYLSSIFGPVGTVLSGAGGTLLLGKMFKVFNTSVLALGSLIVTYTTAVGIMMTAHEGEFMGKKFHSIWMPIRTVAGVAALVPTSGGYSYLQIMMMWLIIQGVGAADTLWSTTIAYIQSGAATQPTTASGGMDAINSLKLKDNVKTLFKALVCQAAAKAPYGYHCPKAGGSFCNNLSEDDMLKVVGGPLVINGVYKMGPDGDCGSLTLADTNSATPAAVKAAQLQAYQNIVPTLGAIAKMFVDLDYTYSTFINTPPSLLLPTPVPSWISQFCVDNAISPCDSSNSAFSNYPTPSKSSDQDKIKKTITNLYWKAGLQPAVGDFLLLNAGLYFSIVSNAATVDQSTVNSSGSVAASTDVNKLLDQANVDGWIFAGAYYYVMADANRKLNKRDLPAMTLDVPITPMTGTIQTLSIAANTLMDEIEQGESAPEGSIDLFSNCKINNKLPGINSLCNAVVGGWMQALSGGGQGGGLNKNPMIAAQNFGQALLITIEVVVPILVVGAFLAQMIAVFAGATALGTGVPGAAQSISSVISMLEPLLSAAIGFIFVLAATLAIYTPLIPFILFTFGAIGWMIATVETMVAAPLVAIGLLYPEGHEMWGQAEKAFMLILNIFLRPSLMVFGMMAGMLMSYVVISFINYAFLGAIKTISPTPGLTETVLFMTVYTSLFVTSLNKCFSLIHVIPDKVLRWIGGGGEQFGEAESLGQISGGFEKGAGTGGRVAGGAASSAGGAGKKSGEKQKKQSEQADAKFAGKKPQGPAE